MRNMPGTRPVPSAPTKNDVREDERVRAELADGRGAERDDPGDEVGPAGGEHAGEDAAAALADDRDALAGGLGEALQAGLEPGQIGFRAADVGADPGAARVVAVLAQPARHRRHRTVAGQEAGDQEHRAAVAVGHAAAPPDRAAEERGRLDTGASFAPERGKVRKRNAHVHFVPASVG